VFVSRDKFAAAIERFRGLPPDAKQQIVDLLRAHHADCAEIVRARETLLLNEGQAPVKPEEVDQAVQLIRNSCAELLRYVRANDPESIRRRGFTNWQQAELESFTHSTAEEIAVAWKLAQKASDAPVAERPDAIADQDLLWLEAVLKQLPETPIPWEMHRSGPDLRFDAAALEPADRSASPRRRHFVRIPACGTGLEVVRTDPEGNAKEDRELERNPLLPIADSDRKIEVRTDRAILECEAWTPPRWAARFGWDRRGVFADFAVTGVAFTLRWIPPGEFFMGSPEDEPGRWEDEGPPHRVTIGRGFWLGETPVTQAQYAAVTGQRPSYFQHAGDRAPVEQVDWDDCQAFCEKLTGLVPDFDSSLAFRLPSEAEWEYACRAGTAGALYTGTLTILGAYNGPELDAIAWYGGNSRVEYEGAVDSSDWKEKQYDHQRAGTHPVRQKRPNPWGLYDMLGNVWEWCEDGWHSRYQDAPTDGAAWAAEGSDRVCRGGCWARDARRCRCAYRDNWGRGARYGLGFRLVLAPRSQEDISPFS
jgi:formylglycine-generating enzyme required for sulfatase activity